LVLSNRILIFILFVDDTDSYSGFTVVDKPGMKIGFSEWEKLVLLTRPLSSNKKNFKNNPTLKEEKYNVAIDILIFQYPSL